MVNRISRSPGQLAEYQGSPEVGGSVPDFAVDESTPNNRKPRRASAAEDGSNCEENGIRIRACINQNLFEKAFIAESVHEHSSD